MKGKKIVLSIILIINMFLITACGNASNEVMDSVNPKVTFEPVSNSFYYDQLDEEETEVFEMILNQCRTYKGGLIELEEPISSESLLRINYVLHYDETHRFWPLASLYIYDEQNRDISDITDERIVSKIYVQFAEVEENPTLDAFRFQFSEDKVLLNEEEFIGILENTTITEDSYMEISQQIAEIEQEIIAEMPKDIRQKEALFYFCNWIRKNMEYDLRVFEVCTSMEYQEPFSNSMYANVAFERSIIEKKGLCGSFAIVVSHLCNQVGIPAYPVIGTVDTGGVPVNHGWVAVEIGGQTLYIDPTFVNGMGKMDALANKNQMEQRRSDGRRYVFTEVFEY